MQSVWLWILIPWPRMRVCISAVSLVILLPLVHGAHLSGKALDQTKWIYSPQPSSNPRRNFSPWTPVVLKPKGASESPENVWKYRLLGPTPSVSRSEGPGWDLRMDISNRLPSGTEGAGLGLHFENRCVKLGERQSLCECYMKEHLTSLFIRHHL